MGLFRGNCVKIKKMVRLEREPQQFQPAPETSLFHPPERKTELMIEVEDRFGGQPIEEILFQLYGEQGNSEATTAATIGVGKHAVRRWLKECRIGSRTRSEAAKISWQDPERREELLKKRNNPQTLLKRSQAAIAQWEREREKMMKANQKGAQTRMRMRREELENQIGRPVGEYLKEAKNLGLTKTEVCSRLHIDWGILERYLEREGIEWPSGTELRIQMEWEKRKGSPEMKLVEEARKVGVFSQLSGREQIVLNRRFPKEGKMPESLSFLGEKFGFTKQWTHIIQVEAIEKLRSML